MRLFFLIFLFSFSIFAADPKLDPVDPEVMKTLNDMGTYLRTLNQFALDSKINFQTASDDNQRFDFFGKIKFRVMTPRGLFLDIKTERKHRQFFYDGKTFTLFGPKNKFYAQVPFEGTNQELLDILEKKYQIEIPLADLFDWGTSRAQDKDIVSAILVEVTKKDNHFAIRQGGVDWQIWLPKKRPLLPKRLIYINNQSAGRPAFRSDLKWKLKKKISSGDFTFTPPKSSYKIELLSTELK